MAVGCGWLGRADADEGCEEDEKIDDADWNDTVTSQRWL